LIPELYPHVGQAARLPDFFADLTARPISAEPFAKSGERLDAFPSRQKNRAAQSISR
jgi:hypothetical protein